jgi:hypothetical protein
VRGHGVSARSVSKLEVERGRDVAAHFEDLEQLIPFFQADELDELAGLLAAEQLDVAALGLLLDSARRRQRRGLLQIVLSRVRRELSLRRPQRTTVAQDGAASWLVKSALGAIRLGFDPTSEEPPPADDPRELLAAGEPLAASESVRSSALAVEREEPPAVESREEPVVAAEPARVWGVSNTWKSKAHRKPGGDGLLGTALRSAFPEE